MPFINFRETYVQFGKSHYEENNIIMHMICTPLILWGVIGFASLTGPLVPTPDWLAPFIQFSPEGTFDLSLGAFIMLFYFLYSLALDFIYAFLFFPILICILTTTHYLIQTTPDAPHYFYLAFICGAFLNHVGHYFIEKRRPRVYEGDFFTVFFAYFYVTYTFLMHLGYRTEFYQELRQEINQSIQSSSSSKPDPATPSHPSKTTTPKN
ncbi:hypothetical protein AYI68_g576 [Smittium mucronatum]|uniref:Endoplasmic reticulum membrane protein n=1 Tax=Smittium mucronatum TaxID=133383 RepID=A0A1R0H810_9FUNG|nr:hypothetical protein AYI68_g576 [Smittium mucronatum]